MRVHCVTHSLKLTVNRLIFSKILYARQAIITKLHCLNMHESSIYVYTELWQRSTEIELSPHAAQEGHQQR